ncbi:uncharacterized protein LOC144914451 [Branchiostoma floridae x Branchiostoma belcheri]
MYHCINCHVPRAKSSVTPSHENKMSDTTVVKATGISKTDNLSNANADNTTETKGARRAAAIESEGDTSLSDSPAKCEALQRALMEFESTLANTKIHANKFEAHVSSQMEIIMKKLDSVNSAPKKDDAELRNLREENARLRRRVQILEESIASLQSTSVTMQKDLRDIRQSQDVLKVKVSNVREDIRCVRDDKQSPKVQREEKRSATETTETLPKYTLPTANRFDALTPEPTFDDQVSTGEREDLASESTQKQKRVVLIGDSNAHKLKPHLLCPTADIPMPYWSPNLFTAPTVMETISKEDITPNTVILHMGTNDVIAKSSETVISEIELVVSTTRSLFPDAEIVISAVPPRRDSNYRPNLNKDITAINKHVEGMCKSNDSLVFVNHPQMWSDGEYNPNMFERDGYHLNSDGVRILAFNLKRQATNALGLTSNKNHARRHHGRSNKVNPGRSNTASLYNQGRQASNNKPTRRESYAGPAKPDQYRQTRYGGRANPSPFPYGNSNAPYSQPKSSPGVPPNGHRPASAPQQKAFVPGNRQYFAPPAFPNGPNAPAPRNRPTPTPDRWMQEWPSPAEAYGGTPAIFRPPPSWFAPPPFPYYGSERSW